MSKLLQLRGGTTAEHASFTGAVREVTVDTTKDTLVVHDGTTAGGHALSTAADVSAALATLVDSAPATLNTLNELAAALNDDASFSTTVTDSIALKAPIASPTFTGNIGMPNGSIDRAMIGVDQVDGSKIEDDSINSEHIANGAIDLAHMSANSVDSDQYVDGSVDDAHISGMAASKLTGALPAISGASLTNLPTPSLLATPGGVGSYTMGYHISNSTAARAAGYTFAGSLLQHTYGHGSSSVDFYPASMSMQYGQTTRSLGFGGTWKAMYAFRTGNWTSQWYYVAVLCQRIS